MYMTCILFLGRGWGLGGGGGACPGTMNLAHVT